MRALVSNFKKTISGIPPALVRFLLRGLALFIAWRLLYELVLKPLGIPDHQLTELILWSTYYVLHPFYDTLAVIGYTLYIGKEPIITFTTGCNGLELMVLYAGFLICYPTNFKRFISFFLGGYLLIILMNIARCAALTVLYYNAFPLSDFMHHYLFKLIIYAVNFYLWVLYCRTNAVPKT